jgi:hypothetical protein
VTPLIRSRELGVQLYHLGISASSVHRIWRAHGLQPHRVPQFKLSFVEKVREVVGLYLERLPQAIVLWPDEKSQIQALDRIQPGLPVKKACAGTMTPRYNRHGSTMLFAALKVLDGTIICRNISDTATRSSFAS